MKLEWKVMNRKNKKVSIATFLNSRNSRKTRSLNSQKTTPAPNLIKPTKKTIMKMTRKYKTQLNNQPKASKSTRIAKHQLPKIMELNSQLNSRQRRIKKLIETDKVKYCSRLLDSK